MTLMLWALWPLLLTNLDIVIASNQQCRPIRSNFPLCGNLYNDTIFPNFLQHRNFDEASLELVQFKPLVQVECSKHLRFFLCTIYVPICGEGLGKIPPCRSLCEAAREGCDTLMKQFGFEWPQNMRCDRYPSESTDLCVPLNVSKVQPTGSTPTRSPQRNYTIPLDCQFKCPQKQKKPDDGHYAFMGEKECASKCEAVHFEEDQHAISRTWIMFWSIACVISTSFTLLTFVIDTSRFKYPERPIIFLSGCYLVVAVVFIIGYVAGDGISCHKASQSGLKLLNQGTDHAACTVTFMFVYFFLMAASIWWVVLALTWFLAAGLKWGHEAIEASSQYFHAAAWAIPAAKTIAILAMNEVDGDMLSGICFVGGASLQALRGFVLAPLFAYLLLGAVFLFAGFISLIQIRSVLKSDRSLRTDKLTKLMIRIAIFSVLYMLPAIVVIACLLYEQEYRQHWDKSWVKSWCEMSRNCNEVTCNNDVKCHNCPDFAVFMIKYLMMLMVGITSGFWIWSGKTIHSWRVFYYTKILRKPVAKYHGSRDGSSHTNMTGKTVLTSLLH